MLMCDMSRRGLRRRHDGDFFHFDMGLLARVASEAKGVNRVTYDVTAKTARDD